MMSPTAKTPQSIPAPHLDASDRESLMRYFENTWHLYEWLFSSLRSEESYQRSPDPLRNPLIFYWGHTAAFYVNKLRLAGLIDKGIDPVFDKIFAVGVDPADAEEISQQPHYPAFSIACAYRKQVYDLVRNFIAQHDFKGRIGPDDPEWALWMAFEHDRIHFETSSVLIRQLPTEYLQKPEGWRYAEANAPSLPLEWKQIPAQKVKLGRPRPLIRFGWDNEFGQEEVEVAQFSVANRHVTNGEYLDFVKAGGYERQEFWTEAGWAWLKRFDIQSPRFWIKDRGAFRYRAMFDELEMPHSWPVELSCHEALAYCAWLGNGHRLLTEAEWRILANDAIATHDPHRVDGRYNLHALVGSPWSAASSSPQGSLGLYDVLGNVWTWLSDDWHPLEGFEPHPYYPEFSNLYFDAEHGMLRGGSWASTGLSASPNYRLWFRREFMQHAGFRLAKSN